MNLHTRAVAGWTIAVLILCSVAQADRRDRSDSRSPFPHHIALQDYEGNAVSATSTDPKKPPQPYSPANTCGKCHDYETISTGWHFNANLNLSNPGRNGEPWIYTDAVTRTQIPLSYRGWKGTWKPASAGLSDFEFLTVFGRQFPGGGPGQAFQAPTAESIKRKEPEGLLGQLPPEKSPRWAISGPFQIDCLICHVADNSHDANERARQVVERENFKWAPTAAMHLATIDGSARSLKDNWNPKEANNPDSDQPPGPATNYQKEKFEGGEVSFNVVRTPPSQRCYFCHTSMAPTDSQPRWEHEGDIHIAKGLKCADCHRNGLDHMTIRGYETEWKDRKEDKDFVAAFSCKGCHLGVEDGKTPMVALGGHMAAPRPEHRGLPAIHLEKLSCTACHSGAFPTKDLQHVQTSMAHALGVVGGAPLPKIHGADQMPLIGQVVFLRDQATGKITPNKITWPNFWGLLKKDGSVEPMPIGALDKNQKTALNKLFPVLKGDTLLGQEAVGLTQEQVIAVIKALSPTPTTAPAAPANANLVKAIKTLTAPGGEVVYISGGQMLRLEGGKLAASQNPAAEPYAWPLAHDVRPANQSLGARGCADCHSSESPVYFGNVVALGPVTGTPVSKAMYAIRGDDGTYASLFARSFIGRPLLKVICFTCAGVLLFIMLLYAFRSVGDSLARTRRNA